ncbi:MAG: hypothetical protein WC750_00795 [Patescibacteria group bacterium]|jgi:hypothetical protein
MLEHLFGSKTRVKLLTLFLNKPDEAYFIRELTRKIDTQINAVRREIENLAKMGLLVEIEEKTDVPSKRPGLKRKYYQVNHQFPLLGEIQALMTKSHLLLERAIDREIASIGNVSYLAFMGVFLGKKAPVDLLIVGTVDADRLKKIVQKAEKDLDVEINFTCLTPQEFTYRREIDDRFLNSVLSSPKCVAIDQLNVSPEPQA